MAKSGAGGLVDDVDQELRELVGGGLDLRRRGFAGDAGPLFGGGDLGVGVACVHEVARQFGEGLAAGEFAQLGELGG